MRGRVSREAEANGLRSRGGRWGWPAGSGRRDDPPGSRRHLTRCLDRAVHGLDSAAVTVGWVPAQLRRSAAVTRGRVHGAGHPSFRNTYWRWP